MRWPCDDVRPARAAACALVGALALIGCSGGGDQRSVGRSTPTSAASTTAQAERSTSPDAGAVASPTSAPAAVGSASIATLLQLIPAESDGVDLARRGSTVSFAVPWVVEPSSLSEVEVFEREVGLRRDQIEVIAVGVGGLVVVAIAADRDAVVRRVVEESPWAAEAVAEEVGDVTLVRFGDERDVARRSLIRPIGEPGALAIGDGLMLWSTDPAEVADAVEGAGQRRLAAAVLSAAGLGPWSSLTSAPAWSVQDVVDFACEVTCDEPFVSSTRERATRFGNPVPYERLTLVRGAEPSEVALVFRHTDVEAADLNALVLSGIVDSTVAPPFGDEQLVGAIELVAVERVGLDVVVRLTEARDGAADVLFVSSTLAWDAATTAPDEAG